jgi:hypothetical protein
MVLGLVDINLDEECVNEGYRYTCIQTGKNICNFLTRNNKAPKRIKRINNNLKNLQGEADFQKMIIPNTIYLLLYSIDVGNAFDGGLVMFWNLIPG